jgi:threonine synthase
MTVPLVERYRSRLPIGAGDPVVSLYEGSTPLVHAAALSGELGVDLWLKLESMNPTGSFKDRGMTVAVSRAVADGATGVVCASTGNTAASAAAYAARAGLTAEILLPAGAVALGKLAQARAVGARLVAVRGTFDETLRAARSLGDSGRYVLVNSLNPFRIEGQKTAAFEIAEELGRVPDVLALPYGGGGNTRAYARGFAEWDEGMPRIVAGAAARRDDTLASAIRIAQPAHKLEAEEAIRASGGLVVELSDDEILAAWRRLAELEGVFCEPASAAGVAAIQKSEVSGTVVAVITGHGLKDPDAASRIGNEMIEVDADAVVEALV